MLPLFYLTINLKSLNSFNVLASFKLPINLNMLYLPFINLNLTPFAYLSIKYFKGNYYKIFILPISLNKYNYFLFMTLFILDIITNYHNP